MDLSQWFNDQLQASADGLIWGAQQIAVERQINQPPEGLGEWSVALFYGILRTKLSLPGMRQWPKHHSRYRRIEEVRG
jgi:hypothetical protein